MKLGWIAWGVVCLLVSGCGRAPATVPSPVPSVTVVPSPSVGALPALPALEPSSAGVAIYLTAGDVTPADLVIGPDSGGEPIQLDALPLQSSPIIFQDDIVTYDASTHAFTLTPEARERLAGLMVAVAGPPFVMTVAGVPVYVGAFWTPLSSLSFDGVVILVMPDGSPATDTVYHVELGYPGPDFFYGEDPRSDLRILSALGAAGKLLSEK